MTLAGRKILLGVSGGIAAYKSPMLVRELTRRGAEVQPVLTRAAAEFVTSTTLQAVSGRPTRCTLWDPTAEAAMGHIELARWADLILIAPATAHMITKLATGAADDLLSTLCLAAAGPIAIAPSMNQQMWQNPATHRNLARVRGDGIHVWGPASGDQACGETGPGRMLEPEELASRAEILLGGGCLEGVSVLLTAGPTQEAIDPVRYISNHSSGKQGYALARAFREAGARVTLISGPVHLEAPDGVEVIHVVTANEMHDAVMSRLAQHQIFVGVAAVADYRPEAPAGHKIKKSRAGAPLNVALIENPDIIAAVARHPARPFVVGFAAETERAQDHAREKLERKGLDLIVVNDVADRRIGFASNDNAVTIVSRTGAETLPLASKIEISRCLVARIAERFRDMHEAPSAGESA